MTASTPLSRLREGLWSAIRSSLVEQRGAIKQIAEADQYEYESAYLDSLASAIETSVLAAPDLEALLAAVENAQKNIAALQTALLAYDVNDYLSTGWTCKRCGGRGSDRVSIEHANTCLLSRALTAQGETR